MVYCMLTGEWAPTLNYAVTSIIFIVVLTICPLILTNINPGFVFDYISNMTVANSKTSAPLVTVRIFPRFSIYQYLNITYLKLIIYSVRLIHLNSVNKVEVEV